MIIFGTRGVTYTHESGNFHCPRCATSQPYRYRRVRRFFTLYFIPLIPLDLLGEYIECRACAGTFHLEVLSYDPRAEQALFEAQFEIAIRRVMVLMKLADGSIDANEVAILATVYGNITGRGLTEHDVRSEAAQALHEGASVEQYLGHMGNTLNDTSKELIIKAAYWVAAADGHFAEEERQLLGRIAAALHMSAAHLRGILDLLQQGEGRHPDAA